MKDFDLEAELKGFTPPTPRHNDRLTGVQSQGSFFLLLGAIGVSVAVPVRLPVVVDDEQGEQDDGDNLQGQGQDGELEPHVGGVGRHPATGVGLSLAPLTRTLSLPRLPPFLLVFSLSFIFSFCFVLFFKPCALWREGRGRCLVLK